MCLNVNVKTHCSVLIPLGTGARRAHEAVVQRLGHRYIIHELNIARITNNYMPTNAYQASCSIYSSTVLNSSITHFHRITIWLASHCNQSLFFKLAPVTWNNLFSLTLFLNPSRQVKLPMSRLDIWQKRVMFNNITSRRNVLSTHSLQSIWKAAVRWSLISNQNCPELTQPVRNNSCQWGKFGTEFSSLTQNTVAAAVNRKDFDTVFQQYPVIFLIFATSKRQCSSAIPKTFTNCYTTFYRCIKLQGVPSPRGQQRRPPPCPCCMGSHGAEECL